jgi:hypothetical protein
MSKINLTQLRADATYWKNDPNAPPPPYEPIVEVPPDTLLALIDTAEAAQDFCDEPTRHAGGPTPTAYFALRETLKAYE